MAARARGAPTGRISQTPWVSETVKSVTGPKSCSSPYVREPLRNVPMTLDEQAGVFVFHPHASNATHATIDTATGNELRRERGTHTCCPIGFVGASRSAVMARCPLSSEVPEIAARADHFI